MASLALCLVVATAVGAQTPAPASREAQLARGWGDLAAGRAAAAGDLATRLLLASPRDHDAVSLSIAAALAGPGPIRGLDAYERWLSASGREDPSLLEDLGRGFLLTHLASKHPGVRYTALGTLARYGHPAAQKQIAALADEAAVSVEAEAALARAGHPSAVQRLRARIAAGGPQDKSEAINALKDSGQPGVVAAIADALSDPAPPSRIAAASALAELGAVEALPQLRAAAADSEPSVRTMVGIAMGLLGDPAHQADVAALSTSPLGDFRLLHARAEARRDPKGTGWVAVGEALLTDQDPAVRLGAADLLLGQGRFGAADAVVIAALDDPSPPIRMLAARVLGRLTPSERTYPILRKALRDTLPEVIVEAARALLPRR